MGLARRKDALSRLDATVKQSFNKNFEYEDRIKRCEDAIKENRNAMQQMASHTNNIERAIAAFQQEQMEGRSNNTQKLQEYRHEVMAMNQSKEQLERLCFSLRDEMRETATKVDTITQELTSLEANIRMQGRLLEDNSKRNLTPVLPTPIVPLMPLPPQDNKMSETARLALEGKIIQMNTTIQDLTQRLNQEVKKRDKVETEINTRMNELLEDYSHTKVEKDRELREFDEKMRELQSGFSASEKKRILMEISSVTQELSRKIDEKEAKLRDDTVHKLTVIQNTLLEENKRRADKEKELQDKVEAQLKEAKLYGDESTDSLRKHIDQHGEQTRNKHEEMKSHISELDNQLKTHRLEHQKVLAAEITDRQNSIKVLEGKVYDVDDRSRLGISELQAAIGNVNKNAQNQKPAPDVDEILRLKAENNNGIREQMAKDVARLENRLSEVETKLKQQDESIDNKIQASKAHGQSANTIMGDKMQQQIDSLIFTQGRLRKDVDALQTKVQDAPKNIENLKDQLIDAESKMSAKLDQERKERMDDVKELRDDIDRIIGKGEKNAASLVSLARLNQDVDETQTGMKKLAEAVHVVKTTLSTKLKDEIKLREQESVIVRRDVDRLNAKYVELRQMTTAAAS
nr:myosin-2-like [Cherax quadricarinatus]